MLHRDQLEGIDAWLVELIEQGVKNVTLEIHASEFTAEQADEVLADLQERHPALTFEVQRHWGPSLRDLTRVLTPEDLASVKV